MARKDRAPTPPKRSQGPQRRATTTSAADAQRRRRTLYMLMVAALALAAAVFAIVLLTGSGDGGGDERAALEAADCTLQDFPAQGQGQHVPMDSKPKWNSSPPTTGPHYEIPAVWGRYDTQVPLIQSVHNLEHGGVVIHYGPDVPQEQVDAIGAWYDGLDDPNGILISPLSTNKANITFTAWTAPETLSESREGERGWLATCTTFDEDAIDAFVDAHRYMGPERISPEQLAPGT